MAERIGHRVAAWPAGRARRIAVILLLAAQAGLLAYSATRHSPTNLEPAFLVSGISHWRFRRFELFRVNPPLVRMAAALPVLVVGCKTDWSRFYDSPGSRAEFPLGGDFIKANGPTAMPLFFYARWACIPFSLIGAYFAYCWATELYRSTAAGFVALILYAFDPNLLAHGELITADGACTGFGIMAGYAFWRWLKQPTWIRALLAGGALGLAELTKLSWLILFGLWPMLWLLWRRLGPKTVESRESRCQNAESPSQFRIVPSLPQLAAILGAAVYLINVGYLFEGVCTPLKDFRFVSTALTGLEHAGKPGNRFRGGLLGELRVPLPKQYLLGIDSQQRDLEDFGQKSYLRGEWKEGGWWYYYLYGLLVKVPCGTWGLLAVVVFARLFERRRVAALLDELVLLTPAVVLLVIVSSQTEFNIHLRYAFPALGMFLVFIGQAGLFLTHSAFGGLLTGGLIGYSLTSAAVAYPHHLSYFNEAAGGTQNGHRHLLGSSIDWGQDLVALHRWHETSHSQSPCFVLSVYRVEYAALNLSLLPAAPDSYSTPPPKGLYAISLGVLESPQFCSHPIIQLARRQRSIGRVGPFVIYSVSE
jgi:hypothetical protein